MINYTQYPIRSIVRFVIQEAYMGWEDTGHEGEHEHMQNVLSQVLPERNIFKLRYACVGKKFNMYLQEMREKVVQNCEEQSLGSSNRGNESCVSIKYG